MVLPRLKGLLTASCAAACLIGATQPSLAIDVLWNNAGTGNYNTDSNWTGAAFGGAPLADFEEVAVIINSGTATLSAPAAATPGGISLGQAPIAATVGAGTLSISAGGALTSVPSPTTNGNVVVGASTGTGTLIMTGGSLTAPNLTLGGAAASAINLSGSSVLNLGTATLGRNLRITGPNVNFSATGAVTLQGAGSYTAEITSAAGHSPIKSVGTTSLNGNLMVQFNGVTPTFGQTWTLVDSTAITGNFANAALGADVTVAGIAPPPQGQVFRLRRTTGGVNGQLLQLGLENVLVLRVNRDTGELSIHNPQGAAVNLDSYTVTSPTAGSLRTDYKGISGAPAGDSGWEKVPGNSATGLAELKPTGSFNISAAGTTVSLGNGFNKTAIASQGIGPSGEDLTFSYHGLGGQMVRGQVEYVGVPYLNNVALIVNSAGQASLKNDTLTAISIDGYSITSSTGALSGSGWSSLFDRTEARFDGWQESPATTSAMSETNPVAPMSIAAGESISLGDIGDFATAEAQQGLALKFIIGNEPTFRIGAIRFAETVSLAGDLDGDQDVDGNDYLLGQRGLGTTTTGATLTTIRNTFGQTGATAAATAVPEPGAAILVAAAWGAAAGAPGMRRVRAKAAE